MHFDLCGLVVGSGCVVVSCSGGFGCWQFVLFITVSKFRSFVCGVMCPRASGCVAGLDGVVYGLYVVWCVWCLGVVACLLILGCNCALVNLLRVFWV